MAGPPHKPSTTATVKFLCRYGGKILPRYSDGNLRYCGGETRVIAVHRSISFSELVGRLGELSGTPVVLRCQLPTEDLDALVSVTCDEDLQNLIEEYDQAARVQSSSNIKIKAFLSLPRKPSPTPSTCSPTALKIPSPKSPSRTSHSHDRFTIDATNHCNQQMSKPSKKLPFRYDKSAGKLLRYACENSSQLYLVHNGNHWQ